MQEQLSVIVVEDDRSTRESFERVLREFGCLVVGTADSFAAAMQLLARLSEQQQGVDALFVDGNLGSTSGDGQIVTRSFREHNPAAKVYGISTFNQDYVDEYVGKNAFFGGAKEQLRQLLFPSAD